MSLPETRRRLRCLLLAPLSALLLAPGLASAQSSEAELKAEIERQQALLDQLESGILSAEPGGGNGGTVDPRVAPIAPVIRELPIAIFDEKVTTVPAGKWGDNPRMEVRRLVLDADGDGNFELVRYFHTESKFLIRQKEDRNYDGRIDAISEFEYGELVRRTLDDDDDGFDDSWETYRDGRLHRRQVDRDHDGVKDAFYSYEGDSLVLEQHDGDNDGQIDREIRYADRHRTTAEEDLDHDGRPDVWYRYTVEGGVERVERIERDKQGRGKPDVFETFVRSGDKAQLARREEDVNGDGTADIISIYREGKLVRRELASADLRPL